MDSLSTVKYLCQSLIFESLVEFENKKIEVNLKDKNISGKLKNIIEENLEFKLSDYKGNNIQAVIDKYGYLDLVYLIEGKFKLPNRNDGIKVLKDYGILQNPQKETTEDELREEREIFEIWFEEDIKNMKSGKLFFKLFGQIGNGTKDWYKMKYRKNLFGQVKKRKIKNVEFIVKEACITNFNGIWSSRYFYM